MVTDYSHDEGDLGSHYLGEKGIIGRKTLHQVPKLLDARNITLLAYGLKQTFFISLNKKEKNVLYLEGLM